ncbi:tetratricopeptide repeat protein [Corallococcus terminator]|uniref:Tetratricopeptide repeat protein n=1 Tax=Corallococcus terminator TaxID=2316733 RepID=A0A3A8I1N0_9BACT|nr:tetratricopeptide repeat protein [Corallococcus terminator]RKG77367.1 tetratricopeptide repeat protein [Corallococcus terminator]
MKPSPNSLWSDLLLLLAVVVLPLVLVLQAPGVTRSETVYFVNGLDVPVQIVAGDNRFDVPAEGRIKREIRQGLVDVDVSVKGAPLSHDTVYVTGDKDVRVYNVLGAAPLFTAAVHYTSSKNPRDSGVVPQPFAGATFQEFEDVDYTFTDPPQTLSTERKHGVITKTQLGVLPGGWKMTLRFLLARERVADAGRVAQALLRATPDAPELMEATSVAMLALEQSEGVLASTAVAREWRDAHPDDFNAHRYWARQMRRAGRNEEARAHYAKALSREPDSVLLAMMLARTEPGPQGTARLEALRRAHPESSLPRWGLAVRYTRERRWAEALVVLDAMEQDEPLYEVFLEAHVRVLAALGRREEALRRLSKRLLETENRSIDGADVLLYARLLGHSTRKGDSGDLEKLIARGMNGRDEDVLRTWLQASLGETEVRALPPDSAPNDPAVVAVRILTALAKGPEAAAPLYATATVASFSRVGTEAEILLAAEFERLGDSALAARALASSGLELSFEELRDAVHGARTVESLDTLDENEKAALHLVVARRLAASGANANADKAYALARQGARLPGPVATALARWPVPVASGSVVGVGTP